MPPRVTAAINNYNYGRYLPDAIESILAQEYAGGIDIVVVDDGSSDDSAERVKPYLDRVRWVALEHGGQAAAFNAAFERSPNDIVCLLDADDWWEPGRVAKVVAAFEKHPGAGYVQHYLQEVDAHGLPVPKDFPVQPETYTLSDLLDGQAVFSGTSGASVRLSKLKGILPVPEQLDYCADEYLYHHALFAAPMVNLPGVLGKRRLHGSNLYHGNAADPEWLARNIQVQDKLDTALEVRLAGHRKRFSADNERRRRLERLQKRFLLARYEWRLADALALWGAMVSTARGAFKLFRGATLLIALVSPRLYLALQDLYGRSGAAKARAALAPD